MNLFIETQTNIQEENTTNLTERLTKQP